MVMAWGTGMLGQSVVGKGHGRGGLFGCLFGVAFLSFFLGFRRPNLITGLSGWRAPN